LLCCQLWLHNALTVLEEALCAVTIATTTAIVESVMQHQGVSQRISVWEVAMAATMPSFALPRPAHLQLPVLPRRPRRLLQGTSLAQMQEFQSKLVVTVAMMTAIAAAATQRLAA